MVVFKRKLDAVFEIVAKVIGLALIVRLFAAAMTMKYERPLDLLFLSMAVAVVAGALGVQRVAQGKARVREAERIVEDDQHSTGTAPTQHAIPLPPPPPMPQLQPTIALPREHPYPNAQPSMNPPPPPWSQLQHFTSRG